MSAETDLISCAANVISAVAATASAGAAIFGLRFIGTQIREARKASDIQALQTFLKDVREHESMLMRADTPTAKDAAFIELMNFIEAYAAAINGKLFAEVTGGIVREKLIDSIADIFQAKAWHDKLQEAITSENTFSCLREFIDREEAAINTVVKARMLGPAQGGA